MPLYQKFNQNKIQITIVSDSQICVSIKITAMWELSDFRTMRYAFDFDWTRDLFHLSTEHVSNQRDKVSSYLLICIQQQWNRHLRVSQTWYYYYLQFSSICTGIWQCPSFVYNLAPVIATWLASLIFFSCFRSFTRNFRQNLTV